MASSSLKQTELEFKNSNNDTGSISFGTSNKIEVNRTFQTSGTIIAATATASASSYSTPTTFTNLTAVDAKLTDDSGDVVSVKAPASVSAHTLTLPSAQGASDTFVKNDGSGNLSFALPYVNWTQFGSSLNQSNFTNSNTNCTIDITNFNSGSVGETMLLYIGTSIHAHTIELSRDLLSSLLYATTGSKIEIGKYQTRYVNIKIQDSGDELFIECGGVTLEYISIFTK